MASGPPHQKDMDYGGACYMGTETPGIYSIPDAAALFTSLVFHILLLSLWYSHIAQPLLMSNISFGICG